MEIELHLRKIKVMLGDGYRVQISDIFRISLATLRLAKEMLVGYEYSHSFKCKFFGSTRKQDKTTQRLFSRQRFCRKRQNMPLDNHLPLEILYKHAHFQPSCSLFCHIALQSHEYLEWHLNSGKKQYQSLCNIIFKKCNKALKLKSALGAEFLKEYSWKVI